MKRTPIFLFRSAMLSLLVAAGSVTAQPASNAGMLGMAELERRGIAEGLTVTEIEAKQRLGEIKGYDRQSRKVKLVVDRRTGEILSREIKLPRF